jgi:hypothetical protein
MCVNEWESRDMSRKEKEGFHFERQIMSKYGISENIPRGHNDR